MKFIVEDLTEKYSELLLIIEQHLSEDERYPLIQKVLDEWGERMMLAPASSINTYHGCYPGGYLIHILNVVKNSINTYKLWKISGADMSGYELKELVFSALFHDFGKLGDFDNEYYIPNLSEWHIKNQGKVYVKNTELNTMEVPHRSIWLLNQYGIKLSQMEYISIMVHDGLFVDGNKNYYSSYNSEELFKTNMPIILHQADYMSYRIEHEQDIKAIKKK